MALSYCHRGWEILSLTGQWLPSVNLDAMEEKQEFSAGEDVCCYYCCCCFHAEQIFINTGGRQKHAQ
jgi:hypothetical protein